MSFQGQLLSPSSGEESNVPNRSIPTLFSIAERAIISLYDAGVLSPAVLERVIGAFGVEGIDWQTETSLRAVDGRSLHQVVISTMMPATPENEVADSFSTIVAHLTDAKASRGAARKTARAQPQKSTRAARKQPAAGDDDANSDELLAQLTSSAAPAGKRQPDSAKRPRAPGGFNPFGNAAPPRKK